MFTIEACEVHSIAKVQYSMYLSSMRSVYSSLLVLRSADRVLAPASCAIIALIINVINPSKTFGFMIKILSFGFQGIFSFAPGHS